MVVAIAVWSLELKPQAEGEEPLVFIPQADVRITGMALGDKLDDANGRTSVKLVYQGPAPDEAGTDDEDDDESGQGGGAIMTTILGSLTPGKVRVAYIFPARISTDQIKPD